eukprot:7016522-Pyramimonas_sp.AAC.1
MPPSLKRLLVDVVFPQVRLSKMACLEKAELVDTVLESWGGSSGAQCAVRAPIAKREREYTRSGHQSGKGRENIPVTGTNHGRGVRGFCRLPLIRISPSQAALHCIVKLRLEWPMPTSMYTL